MLSVVVIGALVGAFLNSFGLMMVESGYVKANVGATLYDPLLIMTVMVTLFLSVLNYPTKKHLLPVCMIMSATTAIYYFFDMIQMFQTGTTSTSMIGAGALFCVLGMLVVEACCLCIFNGWFGAEGPAFGHTGPTSSSAAGAYVTPPDVPPTTTSTTTTTEPISNA
ncbi:hypothetical protein Pelo_11089 [Pelomyxa schiedti]|nr:hypothetical protein Pelo_11089 [Pelomyxa schiedti]